MTRAVAHVVMCVTKAAGADDLRRAIKAAATYAGMAAAVQGLTPDVTAASAHGLTHDVTAASAHGLTHVTAASAHGLTPAVTLGAQHGN